MSASFHVTLALVSWLVVAIAPMSRLGFEDRDLPKQQRRGVSILPAWPLMPLLLLAPIPFLGARHAVVNAIAIVNAVLLVWAIGYIVYWAVRIRRDGRRASRPK